jgi:hypothetical protein
MILLNKYKRWYDSIIDKARARILTGYSEKHHIVPKCCGGSDEYSNIVRLTAREHYICHVLLTKFYVGVERSKLFFAVIRIRCNEKLNGEVYVKNSHFYQKLKEQRSRILSDLFSGEGNPNFGRRHSDEIRRTMHLNRTNENIGKYERSDSEKIRLRNQIIQNNSILVTGINPMSNPESRRRVSESKIGKRAFFHSDTGEKRMFVPGNEPEKFFRRSA